jgi:hypothetical protein
MRKVYINVEAQVERQKTKRIELICFDGGIFLMEIC